MKINFFILPLFGLLFFATFNSSYAVTVYAGSNSTGKRQVFKIGKHDMSEFTIGNDTLSSIWVPTGYRVTLFEHSGFGGRTLTCSAGYLGDLNFFRKITSSLIVEKIHKDGDPESIVTLYTGSNYSGYGYSFPAGYTDSTAFKKVVGNDKINSMKLSPGYLIALSNSDGDYFKSFNQYSSGMTVSGPKTRSFNVVKISKDKVTVGSGQYFATGTTKELGVGEYKTKSEIGMWIRAIYVPKGYKVILHDRPNLPAEDNQLAICAKDHDTRIDDVEKAVDVNGSYTVESMSITKAK